MPADADRHSPDTPADTNSRYTPGLAGASGTLELLDDSSPPPSDRYQITLPILYSVPPDGVNPAREGMGKTQDVSMTGACVELPERLAVGTRIAVVFELDADSLAIEAQVVWVGRPGDAAGGTRHGVVFSGLPAHAPQLIEGVLKASAAPSRIGLAQPLRAVAQAALDVTILNLSRRGACIQHCTLLRPNASCMLSLPSPAGPIHLPARILRSVIIGAERSADGEQQLRYETGLAFPGLTPEQEAGLARVFEQIASPSMLGRALLV